MHELVISFSLFFVARTSFPKYAAAAREFLDFYTNRFPEARFIVHCNRSVLRYLNGWSELSQNSKVSLRCYETAECQMDAHGL